MRLIVVVLSFICTVTCHDQSLPSFSWHTVPQNSIPLLRIAFPDGDADDFALLRKYNPIPIGPNERAEDVDSCIYDGFLQNEKDVYVTVTGCANSDNYQVQFRSARLSGYMFKVVDGKLEEVKSVLGSHSFNRKGISTMFKDRVLRIPDETDKSLVAPSGRALNPNGYVLRVKIRYDENFKDKFGADSVNVARRVIAQAQNIWMWKASLTTTVKFEVDPAVDAIPGRFVAENDLPKVGVFSVDPSIDANVVLAFRNNAAGTIGIAWGSSACSTEPKWRTSLNEYVNDDLKSGEVGYVFWNGKCEKWYPSAMGNPKAKPEDTVAHEIGHNLGMEHDFNDDPKNKRFDSKGNACSGVGGVMDYHGTVNKWSSCSVEDFTKYVDSNKPFCLKAF